jgi:hypothetical protein
MDGSVAAIPKDPGTSNRLTKTNAANEKWKALVIIAVFSFELDKIALWQNATATVIPLVKEVEAVQLCERGALVLERRMAKDMRAMCNMFQKRRQPAIKLSGYST